MNNLDKQNRTQMELTFDPSSLIAVKKLVRETDIFVVRETDIFEMASHQNGCK